MLLTIATTHPLATDLGFLLHKHPDRFQTMELSFGRVHLYYPRAAADFCEFCLLLDVDPVGLVRGRGDADALLAQYVNDRVYVASSFLSVAIAQVLGSALQGRCKERPDLVESRFPLTARLEVLPVRGGERFLRGVFEPLGYTVVSRRLPLDEQFPEWGESHYYSVELEQVTTLKQLLTHLYVLIPVFDNSKHYYVGQDELEKLLRKGEGWLGDHPLRDEIARRFLRYQTSLYRQALARLEAEGTADDPDPDPDPEAPRPGDRGEAALESPLSLHDLRLATVLNALRSPEIRRVLDLGCGEGKLLRLLLGEKQFEMVTGMDVSIRALEVAEKRLRLDRMTERRRERIQLIHGSLLYRDERLKGFDAAALVEVIEHLDRPRLQAMERTVFEFARPSRVVVTTPNREYNTHWENVGPDKFRHPDHRFEWTRSQFQSWADAIGLAHGYSVSYQPIGPIDPELGAPTQMAVFERSVDPSTTRVRTEDEGDDG